MLSKRISNKNTFNYKASMLVVLSTMAFSPLMATELVKQKSSRPLYVEGELLVKAKAGFSVQASKQFISAQGDVAIKQVGKTGLTLVKLAPGDSVQAAMNRYQASSGYELVQPNFKYYATATANDTDYTQLWGLKNTGQTVANATYSGNNPGTAGADIDAELAWDIRSDCSSHVVAVVDTGVNYTHADLAANRWVNPGEIPANDIDDDGNGIKDDIYGADFYEGITGTPDGDPMPTDAQNHGTHVAGTIGAVGDNNAGMTGVCKTAKIMSVRTLGTDGGTTESVVNGVNYAVANGAKVINMSLGGGGFDPSFDAAITAANAAGVVVVVAAGNAGSDNEVTTQYPCNFTQDNLVCVAALDQTYALANFSNWGSTSVDVGAPGTNIHSAWAGSQIAENFSTGWTGVQDGTGGAPANVNSWTHSNCDFTSGTYDTLVNPYEQCGAPYGPYQNDEDDRAYKDFVLNGTILGASLEYYARVRTADTNDTFKVGFDTTAGGDPFDLSGGDTVLDTLSGDQGASWYFQEYDIGSCIGTTCSIGFQFASDPSGTGEGVSVILMAINTTVNGSTSYEVINGTSMATPHAAGVAALIYAQNPTYTAAEVAYALKNSGETVASLAGNTTTGKAINAYNAVRYIQPPQGVTAVVQ